MSVLLSAIPEVICQLTKDKTVCSIKPGRRLFRKSTSVEPAESLLLGSSEADDRDANQVGTLHQAADVKPVSELCTSVSVL